MAYGVKIKQIITYTVPLLVVFGILVWTVSTVMAAGNTLYLSSSASSVQSGNTFVVSLRVNPGMSIDTVTASVSYNAAMVSLVSITCSSSPFSAFPSCPTSGNPVSITAADLGGTVSSDTLIAQLTFKALVTSGTGSFGLTGNDATAGTPNNPTTTGTSVTFTAPPCPSGYSGTYPNCVAPTPPPSGGSTGGSGGSSSGGSGTLGGSSSGSSGSKTPPPSSGSSTQSPPAATAPKVVVTGSNIQYSQASLTLSSSAPAQVWIEYGTDQQHYTNTVPGAFATTHQIALDSSVLVPGETYYYVVVSKDQAGQVTQSNVQTFQTKGLNLRINAVDAAGKPLRRKTLTLHSAVTTAKTDDKGYATFGSITPGVHTVSYVNGGKTYTKQIAVENNVQTDATNTQTAAMQNVSVVLPFKQSPSMLSRLLPVVLLLLVAVVAYVFRDVIKRKFAFASATMTGSREASMPVVTSENRPPATMPSLVTPDNRSQATTSTQKAPSTTLSPTPTLDDRLGALSAPSHPNPGTTITPADEPTDSDNKDAA